MSISYGFTPFFASRFSQKSHVVSVPENVAEARVHAIVAVDQDEGERKRDEEWTGTGSWRIDRDR